MKISTFGGVVSRQWLTIVAVLLAGLLAFVILEPVLKKWSATATVLISTASQNSAVLDPTRDPTSSGIGVNDLVTLLSTSVVTDRVIADLQVTGAEAQRVPGELHTKISPGSGVLPIIFTDRDPAIAVAGANDGARELSRYDNQIKTLRYDRLLADLNRQIASSRSHLAAIDGSITGLTSDDAFLTEAGGTTGLNTRIMTLGQQRDTVLATLRGDTAAASVAGRRPALAKDLAKKEIENTDPALAQARLQYGKDLAQANVYSAGYKPGFDGLRAETTLVAREGQTVQNQIAAASSNPNESTTFVTALLDDNKARAAVASDVAQLASIQGQMSALTQHLSGSGSTSSRLTRLLRERSSEEASFRQLALNASKAEADRAQAASIDTVVVLDKASFPVQSTFSRPAILGTAIGIVALWLALTLAFLLDGNDRRLHTPESIEKLYGKPVFQPIG